MKLTKKVIRDIIDFLVFVAVYPEIIKEYNKLINELNKKSKVKEK